MGDRAGSSPVIRTKKHLPERVGVFRWVKITGLEPLGIFALRKQFGKLFLAKMGEGKPSSRQGKAKPCP